MVTACQAVNEPAKLSQAALEWEGSTTVRKEIHCWLKGEENQIFLIVCSRPASSVGAFVKASSYFEERLLQLCVLSYNGIFFPLSPRLT